MMRATRTASLLVAFYILISAATASAERAWVLWVNEWFDASLDRAPSDVQAFATRSDCLAAMEQTAQTFMGIMGSEAGIGLDTRSGSGSLYVVGKGHSVTIRCVPDTVDPLGAKGR